MGKWRPTGRFSAKMRDLSKKGFDIPDANHGAGICTKLGHKNVFFFFYVGEYSSTMEHLGMDFKRIGDLTQQR